MHRFVADLEEAEFAGEGDAEVLVGEAGGDAAAWGAVEEADLDEEGFVDLFEGVLLFGEGGGEGVEADRAAVVLLDDGAQQAAVEFVEAVGVDLQQRERGLRGGAVDAVLRRGPPRSRGRGAAGGWRCGECRASAWRFQRRRPGRWARR